MKKIILLLVCCGVVMCSACNKAEPPPVENSVLTVSHTKTTESETESSSTIEESITTEKEKSTPVKSKQTETSSIIVIKEEPDKTVKIKEISEPTQETYTATEEEIAVQVIADSAEVEQLVVKYINEFRVAQGDTADFEPIPRKIRKQGTGCVFQINENLWEGSYNPRLPGGKRKKYNVYAKNREECEKLLAEMIERVKAEIAEMKQL